MNGVIIELINRSRMLKNRVYECDAIFLFVSSSCFCLSPFLRYSEILIEKRRCEPLEVCGLPVPAVYPYPTRTRGYGSGTGRCLTGRVGYGTKSTGTGIPVFTRKEHHFHDVGAISNVFLFLPY